MASPTPTATRRRSLRSLRTNPEKLAECGHDLMHINPASDRDLKCDICWRNRETLILRLLEPFERALKGVGDDEETLKELERLENERVERERRKEEVRREKEEEGRRKRERMRAMQEERRGKGGKFEKKKPKIAGAAPPPPPPPPPAAPVQKHEPEMLIKHDPEEVEKEEKEMAAVERSPEVKVKQEPVAVETALPVEGVTKNGEMAIKYPHGGEKPIAAVTTTTTTTTITTPSNVPPQSQWRANSLAKSPPSPLGLPHAETDDTGSTIWVQSPPPSETRTSRRRSIASNPSSSTSRPTSTSRSQSASKISPSKQKPTSKSKIKTKRKFPPRSSTVSAHTTPPPLPPPPPPSLMTIPPLTTPTSPTLSFSHASFDPGKPPAAGDRGMHQRTLFSFFRPTSASSGSESPTTTTASSSTTMTTTGTTESEARAKQRNLREREHPTKEEDLNRRKSARSVAVAGRVNYCESSDEEGAVGK